MLQYPSDTFQNTNHQKPSATQGEQCTRQRKVLKKDGSIPPLRRPRRGRGILDGRSAVSLRQLRQLLDCTAEEFAAIRTAAETFPMKIPRHYAEIMEKEGVLRQVVVPSPRELARYPDDVVTDVHADESTYQPVEGIIHRYPGKLLFFPTLRCFGHCRFCFRAGQRVSPLGRQKTAAALDYIRRRSDVREVLITGGDPLTLPLADLDRIMAEIRAIPHVEIIRIGTRALAYAPAVITREMVQVIARHKPVFMTLSFVHPAEITPLCEEKLDLLADAGIVLLQQGPLLKGVNDDPAVLKTMYEKLARKRVLAYYAIYGIYAPGVRHFIVDREAARRLFQQLENNTSGHCLPHLITLNQNDDKTRSVM